MRRVVLANGLPLIITSAPHLHQVAMRYMVRAGPRYETADTIGISHMLEHLLFHGTARYPTPLAFHRACDRHAIDTNAATYPDALGVDMVLPPGAVSHALDLMADMVQHPRFDTTDLELERNVVAEEILGSLTEDGYTCDPDEIARHAMWAHPMGQPVAGTLDLLDTYDLPTLYAQHRRLFTAANSALAIMGPVDPDQLIAQATRLFGAMPRGQALHAAIPPANTTGPLLVQDSGDAQSHLTLTYDVPGTDHGGRYAAVTLLRYILCYGFSSRIRYGLIESTGLAYDAAAQLSDYGDRCTLEISVGCAPNKLVQVANRLLGIMLDFVPTQVELDTARAAYHFNQQAARDAPIEIVGELANAELLRTPYTIRDFGRLVDWVCASDIRALVAGLPPPLVTVVGADRPRHTNALARMLCRSVVRDAGAFVLEPPAIHHPTPSHPPHLTR